MIRALPFPIGLLVVAWATIAVGQTFDAREVFNRCADAVVRITDEDGGGTGFLVNSNGTIVTNRHVVRSYYGRIRRPDELTVKLRDGHEVRVLSVDSIRHYPELDIALLRVDYQPKMVLPILAGSDAAVGEEAVAIGHPLGLEWTQTRGTISKIDTSAYLQTDIAINPGNSGGPLLNQKGQVVGMATWKVLFFEGTGFALRASMIRKVLDEKDVAYSTQPVVNIGMTSDERVSQALIQERDLLKEERARLDSERTAIEVVRSNLVKERIDAADMLARADEVRRVQDSARTLLADVAYREQQMQRKTTDLDARLQRSQHLYPRHFSLEAMLGGTYRPTDFVGGERFLIGPSVSLLYRFDINPTSDEAEANGANRIGVCYSPNRTLLPNTWTLESGWHHDVALVLDLNTRWRFGVGTQLVRSSGHVAVGELFAPIALYVIQNPVPWRLYAQVRAPRTFEYGAFVIGTEIGYGGNFVRW